MTISRFNMSIAGRTLQLLFDLEDEFYSDQVLSYLLPRGLLPEPEVLNAMARIVEPGACVVDAGANVGFFTVVMSKLVGEDGEVIAIEPDPRNARKLRKNLDINDCRNVVIYETMLAAQSGPRKFYIRSENGSSTMFDGCQTGELVEVRDHFAATLTTIFGDRRPSFMKMDIEGAELEAVLGCDVRIPFVITEANEEALGRAGASIAKLRFQMENIWGHRTHLLSETGSMPALIANAPTQKIVSTRPNANILFAREWDVIRAWSEVRI